MEVGTTSVRRNDRFRRTVQDCYLIALMRA
jgi:hypothetical protein